MNKFLAFVCILLFIICCRVTYFWYSMSDALTHLDERYYSQLREQNLLRMIILIEWKGKRKDEISKKFGLNINNINKGEEIEFKDKKYGSYILEINPKNEDIFVDNLQFKFKSGRFMYITDRKY